MPLFNEDLTDSEALSRLREKLYGTPEQPEINPMLGADVATGGQAIPTNTNLDAMSKMYADKYAQTKPYLDKQEQGLATLENEVNKYKTADKQWNFAPLIAYADQLSGGNQLKGYTAPMTDDERQAKVIGLQDLLQKARGNLTTEQIKALQDKGYAGVFGQNARNQRQQEQFAFNAHKSVISKLDNDTQLKQMFTQLRNLDNAATQVQHANTLTPQQIDEFQQAVRSNLGIKGGSIGEERAKTYIDTLGLRGARVWQTLTGKPEDISKDSELVGHIKDLANVESSNVKQQINGHIDALKAGFDSSVYENHPKYKQDLLNKIDAISKQSNTRALGPASLPQEKTVGGVTYVLNPQTGKYSAK